MTRPVDGGRPGRASLIHREILQIAVLMLVAVAAFFITRAVAANNREMTVRDAEAWYARGQQLISAGRVEDAIASFRRASVRDRFERKYTLALATALERNGDAEAARAALSTLREASPDDVEVNLALARLAAHRQDVTEALRFYHNALYAPWPAEAVRDRRDVRLELVGFLLQRDQGGQAQAELMAMGADRPDEAAARAREIVDLVRSSDPLARQIGSEERRRRLSASLDHVGQRLEACRGVAVAPGEGNQAAALQQEAARLRERLQSPAVVDQDVIEGGVDLLGRIERYMSNTCPPLGAPDQALALIARSHATESK